LFVRVGDSGIKRPARAIISLNRNQPAHWSHFASPSISKRDLKRTLWLIRRPCLRGIGLRPEFQAQSVCCALATQAGREIARGSNLHRKGPSHARFASATGR
jgi:hypothetical protein